MIYAHLFSSTEEGVYLDSPGLFSWIAALEPLHAEVLQVEPGVLSATQ